MSDTSIKKILFWFFKNPLQSLQRIYSFAGNESAGENFTEILRKNKDYICLVTFEEFCKKHKIKPKKRNIVVKHPSRLLGTRILIMFQFEIEVLCKFMKWVNPQKIFEIGTFEGETISNVAYNVADNTEIYTLDLKEGEVPEEKNIIGKYIRDDEKVYKKVKMLSGNSLTFDFLPYYDEIDVMYIDGGTSYDCILSDSENAVKCVRNGGYIIWHDFYGLNKVYLGLANAIFEVCRKYNVMLYFIDGTRFVIAQNIKKKKEQ